MCNFLESSTHFVARNMVSIQHQIFEKVTILSYVKLNFSTQKACEIFSIAVLKQAWKELLERYYYFIAGLLDRILDFWIAGKIRYSYVTPLLCLRPKDTYQNIKKVSHVEPGTFSVNNQGRGLEPRSGVEPWPFT